MREIAAEILEIVRRRGLGTTLSEIEAMTPLEREQYKVDSYNRSPGKLKDGYWVGDKWHEGDGHHCPLCNDKGHLFKVIEFAPGDYRQTSYDCECVPRRNSILRMKRSGLGDVVRDKRFDNYDASDGWQRKLKQVAQEYAADPDGWFFLGGQSGCGKTHLCTAICGELLDKGRAVVYMLWRDDVEQIKEAAKSNDDDSQPLTALLNKYKSADILYIDDLFQSGRKDGKLVYPTSAETRYAFEIINHRAINKRPTVITSEFGLQEIVSIHSAIGGRISEHCGYGRNSWTIPEDNKKNYRTRNAGII